MKLVIELAFIYLLKPENLMLTTIWSVIQLILGIINEIHAVQVALPGAPGADKSAAVIDKVTPIAAVIGAESSHIQSLIDGFVGIFKKIGTLGHAGATAAAVAPDSPAAPQYPGAADQIAP